MHTVRTDGAKNMVIWQPQSQLNGDGANLGGTDGVGRREKRGRKGLLALCPRREREGGRERERLYLWA